MHGQVRSFQTTLINWYCDNRRDLPWRVAAGSDRDYPDPYFVLVSEAMLQQTQVATVIPYFERFVSRFPTIAHLARADEQEVLRLWQGLGYYSRARHLHGTAKIVQDQFRGAVPSRLEQLLELPGIGRYTAGAIASLAFGERAPILDGNVARVLCRIDCIRDDPRQPQVRERLWRRAEEILPTTRVADFNSGLMELGATICTPKAPRCEECPVRRHCQAFSSGLHQEIPASAPARPRPTEKRWTICIQRGNDFLIEQRPMSGRWARMWQFVTFQSVHGRPTPKWVKQQLGLSVTGLSSIGRLTHDLTHRRYDFEAFHCYCRSGEPHPGSSARTWCGLAQLSDFPLPKPHLRIAELLRQMTQNHT